MKPVFRMAPEAALDLFRESDAVRVASVTGDGTPVLKTFNGFVHEGALVFHAGRHGEKMELLGRPCVAAVEHVVAQIPSYFIDPDLACPATTLFRSAQIRGTLEEVTDLQEKVACVAAMMRRFQPEAGYAPLTLDDRRYAATVRGLLVARVRPEEIAGKAKLGQNRSARDMVNVVEGLWQRGAPGDLRAIDLVRSAHPSELDAPRLRAPEGLELVCAPGARHAAEASALLCNQYWTLGDSPEILARAQLQSDAWIVLRTKATPRDEGRVVATARAVGDGVRWSHVKDVIVHPSHRGRGIGTAITRLLLDHPRVRGAARQELATRDAQRLYSSLGFVEHVPPYTTMRRVSA